MTARRKHGDESFQMAPMIDMVFLLLVFFMTVSTMARESRPDIELPLSDTARVPSAAPPREVITLQARGDTFRCFHFNREISLDDLPGVLNPPAGWSPGSEILLRGPPDLPWRCWTEILGHIRKAGFENIVFSTFES